MKSTHQVHLLKLSRPWATSRTVEPGGIQESPVVLMELAFGGHVGFGEAAPIARYGESIAGVREFLDAFPIESLSVDDPEGALNRIAGDGGPPMAGRCALDMAYLDLMAKHRGKSVADCLGLAAPGVRAISETIPLGSVEATREHVRHSLDFSLLKLKMGGPMDRERFLVLREVAPLHPVLVDANEGWKTREMALKQIEWLAGDPLAKLVEQPLPARLPAADHLWLRERSPLPLFADESFHSAADVPFCEEAFHGVNVKLTKTGGIHPALEALTAARSAGLQTMIGCMLESSLGIAAAFQLAALADYLDLDSHLMMVNDPFEGLRLEKGRLSLAPDTGGQGLGVRRIDG